jgi:hypothetical protein
MYEMYIDVIKSFNFFRNINNLDFIYRVLISLRPIRAHRNEVLVKEGELVDEMIIAKRGILSL